MVNVKVLGSGCPNCQRLEDNVRRVVETQGIDARVEKVTDMVEIMRSGALATPALLIDGKLVSAGRIPADKDLTAWLTQAATER